MKQPSSEKAGVRVSCACTGLVSWYAVLVLGAELSSIESTFTILKVKKTTMGQAQIPGELVGRAGRAGLGHGSIPLQRAAAWVRAELCTGRRR